MKRFQKSNLCPNPRQSKLRLRSSSWKARNKGTGRSLKSRRSSSRKIPSRMKYPNQTTEQRPNQSWSLKKSLLLRQLKSRYRSLLSIRFHIPFHPIPRSFVQLQIRCCRYPLIPIASNNILSGIVYFSVKTRHRIARPSRIANQTLSDVI